MKPEYIAPIQATPRVNIPRVRFIWGSSLVTNITITSKQRAGPR